MHNFQIQELYNRIDKLEAKLVKKSADLHIVSLIAIALGIMVIGCRLLD